MGATLEFVYSSKRNGSRTASERGGPFHAVATRAREFNRKRAMTGRSFLFLGGR